MIRSRATAALLRLKEIDNKYKVRYDESKNDARSSVNTDSLSDEDEGEENPRLSPPCEKLEILKPTLNIKIPDTYAEQLDSESSSLTEASPSPKVSSVGKTPVATPRVSTANKTPVVTPRVESTSEIQEALDEGEFIDEILEESDNVEGIFSDKSNRGNASSASSVENLSTRDEQSNVDYSNDSFENDSSEAKSFNSGSSEKKSSEPFVVLPKPGDREEDGISWINVGEESVGSKNEVSYGQQLSEALWPEKTEVEEQSPINEESQSSKKKDDLSVTELNLKPSEASAKTENSRANDDLSSSLKFTHSSHKQSDISHSVLKDSNSVDKLNSDDEVPTSLLAKNTPHLISNANLGKSCSLTDGGEKHEELSTSIKAKNVPRSKSNAKLNKRSSITDGGKRHKELSTFLEAENIQHSKSHAKPSKRSSVTDGSETQKESSRSRKTAQSPHERSEPNPNKREYSNPSDESQTDVEFSKSRESADAFFKSDARREPTRSRKKSPDISIKGRKRSKDHSHVIGNEPDADSLESGSSLRRCSSREITEQRSASSYEQPEVEPTKIDERTARKSRSTFEVRSSRDPSRIVGRKFSDRKKRVPTSGSHRGSKSKEKNLKASKSAPINRGQGEELFEHGDRELERLRARMRDLRLEQERQLMLCYLRDSEEERRKLMMWSCRFYCPGKSELSAIEPLDLPNVANFVKPDRTGVRCSLLLPDDRLELVRNRVADIRQWLKDQFILYRDYSDVASAINEKYVTDAVAAEKHSEPPLRLYDYEADNENAMRNPLAQGNVYGTQLRYELTTKKGPSDAITISL